VKGWKSCRGEMRVVVYCIQGRRKERLLTVRIGMPMMSTSLVSSIENDMCFQWMVERHLGNA
jgi:hypothetical protein